MWAIRRVSNPLRYRELYSRVSALGLSDLGLQITQLKNSDGFVESLEMASDKHLSFKAFYRRNHISSDHFLVRRGLSSQTGVTDSENDEDSENEFSLVDDGIHESTKNDIELTDSEIDLEERGIGKKKVAASMVSLMISTKGLTVRGALDKWVEEGNTFDSGEVYVALSQLRKFRMYGRAVQFLEWLKEGNRVEFTEKEYSALLDCIAKLQGLFKAEKYMEKIPKSFRGEVVYRTFLANCVQFNKAKKAEEVLNKMKDLGFPLSDFTCNQAILLYKRVNKKKIADVLLLMEKTNIKPTLFTYRLLIDVKGMLNDIVGIESLLETMESEGIKPDWRIKALVAKHYIAAGFKEKAKAILKDMEGDKVKENKYIYGALLELYGDLRVFEEVSRVWKICEEKPTVHQSLMAIKAWGKLNEIEKAEAVFESLLKVVNRPGSLHYQLLLEVYADKNMLEKGTELVKRMANHGIQIGPLTLDPLVKLYTEAGLIEKADETLHKVANHSRAKPILFRSYMAILDGYADKGDIPNSEKIFRKMRESGYTARFQQYESLMRAYLNAKSPAYGMRERMKADNMSPNKALTEQLAKSDLYTKAPAPGLLN